MIEDHSDILEKFKKEILEEAGEKSIQPDWNQNNSTAADYVKNRPFYTDTPVETIFVEESTVPFAEAVGVYMGQPESTFVPTVGETYKVSWDGTTYESTCANFNNLQVIGNLSIMGIGSDTGEPFVAAVGNGYGIRIATADTSASHTFSISGTVVPIVKIPAKYIDKDTSGYIVLHRSYTMTEEDVQNYINAYFEGRVCFIMWMDLCITSLDNDYTDEIRLTTQNGEIYSISKIMKACTNMPIRSLLMQGSRLPRRSEYMLIKKQLEFSPNQGILV